MALLAAESALGAGNADEALGLARMAEAVADLDSLTGSRSARVGEARLIEARALLARGDSVAAQTAVERARRPSGQEPDATIPARGRRTRWPPPSSTDAAAARTLPRSVLPSSPFRLWCSSSRAFRQSRCTVRSERTPSQVAISTNANPPKKCMSTSSASAGSSSASPSSA